MTSTYCLSVAEGPHWRDGSSLGRTQWLWAAALAPAAVASVVWFGWPALRVMALAVGTGLMVEALAFRVLGGRDFPSNGSAVSLSLMLAFLLPITAPWWLVAVGVVVTIVVGKKMYGGWGGYPVHPVALGYAMLAVSWPARLDRTASLVQHLWDAVPIEPMRLVKTQGVAAEAGYALQDLLLGKQVAAVANGMVLWLALGGLFLVLVRVVPWQIPLGAVGGILGGAVVAGWLAPGSAATPLFQLFSGSAIFMSFFLLGDSTTSPVNGWPMVIFGLLGGVLLVLIRTFGIHAEGAVFAVLLVNLCHPLLDRLTARPKGVRTHG